MMMMLKAFWGDIEQGAVESGDALVVGISWLHLENQNEDGIYSHNAEDFVFPLVDLVCVDLLLFVFSSLPFLYSLC